jgi:hypothetical protein
MTRRRIVAAGAAFVVLASGVALDGDARAQSWLDKATETLDGLTGGDETGAASDDTAAGGLSEATVADGLREALAVGAERVVAQLGARGGFLDDPAVHIPLPDDLKRAQSLLEGAGLGQYGRDVETRLNRGAEEAMPRAGAILGDSITDLTLADAKAILNGPQDAATQYFRRTAGPAIEDELRPVIESSLQQVGALTALDAMLAQYETLPFVPDVKGDLVDHATDEAMDGLFRYLAEEEAAIRANPAERTTDLLKTVFGP